MAESISEDITGGEAKPEVQAMNIAFTMSGMRKLGLRENALNTFSGEFEDGMSTKHKQLMFGDYGKSDPENWKWGGPHCPEVHIMLMLYIDMNKRLDTFYGNIHAGIGQAELIRGYNCSF